MFEFETFSADANLATRFTTPSRSALAQTEGDQAA